MASKAQLLKDFNGKQIVAECHNVWTYEAWSESALLARITMSGREATIQEFSDTHAIVKYDGRPLRQSRSAIRQIRVGMWTTRSADSYLTVFDQPASFVYHKALKVSDDGNSLTLTLSEGYIQYSLAN
jgi:hypothetical protein